MPHLVKAAMANDSKNLAGESNSSAKSDVWKYFVKDSNGIKTECN